MGLITAPAATYLQIHQHPKDQPVKITDARVVVSSPGRNYVTLVIETEDGVTGIGDATLNGRELAVASYLSSTCACC